MSDHTPDEWAQRLGLARRGAEHVGPCPICGGSDRFRCRAGRTRATLAACRRCTDSGSARWWQQLVETVWGDDTARTPTVPAPPRPARRSRADPKRAPLGDLWAAAGPLTGAAAAYIACRVGADPAAQVRALDGWAALPPDGLPAAAVGRVADRGHRAWLLHARRDIAGRLVGIDAEALRSGGELCQPRHRRTVGRQRPAWHELAGRQARCAVLVEGHLDAAAVALACADPDRLDRPTGHDSRSAAAAAAEIAIRCGWAVCAPAAMWGDTVAGGHGIDRWLLWPDPDSAGTAAMLDARAAADRRRIDVRLAWPAAAARPAGDPADAIRNARIHTTTTGETDYART